MKKQKNELRELKRKLSNSNTGIYVHYNFEVSDDDGFLCISQIREGKRKQSIKLQYSQVKNLIDCIESIKTSYNESHNLKNQIKALEKEINGETF